MAYLIDRFPSPRHRLEKEVHRIREKREEKVRKVTKDRDSSSFTVGKISSETKKEEFEKLQSSGPIQQSKSKEPAKEKPTIDIKKLRKPGKKISG